MSNLYRFSIAQGVFPGDLRGLQGDARSAQERVNEGAELGVGLASVLQEGCLFCRAQRIRCALSSLAHNAFAVRFLAGQKRWPKKVLTRGGIRSKVATDGKR
jgi:hypothetical protein